MTITDTLIRLCQWAECNICCKIKLKVPAKDREPTGENYDYKLINPSVFPMHVPTNDRLPPHIKNAIPSICIQLMTGTDDVQGKKRTLKINMGFSVWDPGTHTKDVYIKEMVNRQEWILDHAANKEALKSGEEKEINYFDQNDAGWMDVWNFVDLSLYELNNTDNLNGLYIDKTEPIQYSCYKEQDDILTHYPFWFAYITFGIKASITTNTEKEFL